MARRLLTRQEAFEDRFEVQEDGCWRWLRAKNGDGYGHWMFRGKWQRAHRSAYEIYVGPIPAGLALDHLCRNRACVNPAHLEPVPNVVNVMRGESPYAGNARKTHCPKGHPYDDANTMYVSNARGTKSRVCKTCHRERYRKPPRPPVTHCKRGHEFTPENTRYNKAGAKVCRTCVRERARKPGGYTDPNRERGTHCPHGHEYTDDNTYTYTRGGREYRYCRACNRAARAKRPSGSPRP